MSISEAQGEAQPREVRLGRYVLRRPLGRGGNGQVFQAWQTNAAKIPLVCVVKFPLLSEAISAEQRDLLIREASVVMKLGNHANIVQVLDVDLHKDMPFVVLEYVNGMDLGRLLSTSMRRQRGLSLTAIYTLLTGVAKGLHHAHFGATTGGQPIGVVHRDIKPGNILITRDGEVKIADFGLGKTIEDGTTGSYIRGTYRYMSPEHLNRTVVPAMDMYALGVVAWELVENRRYRETCQGTQHITAIMDGDVPAMQSQATPRELVSLVHACLEPQPHHRPSAREFLQSLRQCPGYHNSPEELGHALSSIMGTYRASGHTGPSVAATPELEATLAALDVVRKLTEADPPRGDTQRQPGPAGEQAVPRLPDTVKAAAVPIPVASHRPAVGHPPRGADARFSEPGALRPPAMASVSPPVEEQAPPIPPPRSRSRSPVLMVALVFIGLGAMALGAVLLWGQLAGRDTQPVAQERPTSVGFQAPTSRAEPAALSADSEPPRASPMSPWEPEPEPELQRAAEPEPEPEPPSVAPPEPAIPEPAPTVAPDEQPRAKRRNRKKKQATPPPSHPVSVTVILHGLSQGAIRIDGDKIRGVRHGTRLEIPSGRHKFEWRMVGETTWRNAGRHRLTARSYWVRLSEDRGFALGRSGPEGGQ